MKVLWLCNIMLPAVAQSLGFEPSNKEGWLTGLSEMILNHKQMDSIELGLCFPVAKQIGTFSSKVEVAIEDVKYLVSCYGFIEQVIHAEKYDKRIEPQLAFVMEDFKPDVVHIFGTEYPHSLAMTRVCDRRKILVNVQGLCKECGDAYLADLPDRVVKSVSFRDFIKSDTITRQQKKYYKRGESERQALLNAGHIAGRTDWDRRVTQQINPNAVYHTLRETLRPEFYTGDWNRFACEKDSIFVTQGDYPLKGLHYLMKALPRILQNFPDTHVYVAGNSIIGYDTLKQKIKIGAYGNYLRKLMKELAVTNCFTFLGKLDANQMKARYLRSQVYVCCSSLENSPNSLGEAMLLGVPVVASKVGGIPSMVADFHDGLLFRRNCVDELADRVMNIFEDGKLADVISKQAKERAKITHSPSDNYNALIKIYQEIASEESK